MEDEVRRILPNDGTHCKIMLSHCEIDAGTEFHILADGRALLLLGVSTASSHEKNVIHGLLG